MQRVFLIHGWKGSPTSDWFLWARKELEKHGYKVFVPEMPDSTFPKIGPWVTKIKETVGKPERNDIFVGHSMGCQAILRYWESLPSDTKIKKVILIAGFEKMKIAFFDVSADRVYIKPWGKDPIDYPKIKKMADSWVCVFSDNDPGVPYHKNAEIFKSRLGAEIVLKKRMGHFSQEDGVTELPFLLELIK